jgi:hypothetical protein
VRVSCGQGNGRIGFAEHADGDGGAVEVDPDYREPAPDLALYTSWSSFPPSLRPERAEANRRMCAELTTLSVACVRVVSCVTTQGERGRGVGGAGPRGCPGLGLWRGGGVPLRSSPRRPCSSPCPSPRDLIGGLTNS